MHCISILVKQINLNFKQAINEQKERAKSTFLWTEEAIKGRRTIKLWTLSLTSYDARGAGIPPDLPHALLIKEAYE